MKALNSLAHSRRFTLGCLPSPHLSFLLLPPAAQICSERHLKHLTLLRSGPGWPLSAPALPFLSPSSPILHLAAATAQQSFTFCCSAEGPQD